MNKQTIEELIRFFDSKGLHDVANEVKKEKS